MKNYMPKSCFRILKLHKSKSIFILIIFALAFTSCERFFVDDINDEKVELLAPQNNTITGTIAQNFSWKLVDDADSYRLQVFSESTDNSFSIKLDTNLTTNEFNYNLLEGNYFWFVIAENYYSSAYSDTFRIQIDSSGTLENLMPVLTSPSSEYSNITSLTFTWSSLQEAEKYRFDLKKGNWDDDVIDTSMIIQSKTISLILSEGTYCWGVQGIINNIYSGFSYKKLTIDLTAPGKPELDSPEDKSSSTTKEVVFYWDVADDIGSPVYDSISVASDEDFKTISYTKKSTNGESIITFETAATYYWRVKCYDMAGNSSSYSTTRTITIQ